jgi:soluble lytic murein transglycosylase
VSRAARAPSRRSRTARSSRRRAKPRRKPRRRGLFARRRAGFVLVVALAGLAAFAISRIDFEDALREVTLPLRHDDIIRQQAADKDLDPALIAAVIYEESRFRDQTSSAGAVGLMQVTPQTAERIAHLSGGTAFVPDDLGNPDINIRYGSYWLKHLLDHYDGNEVAALAAYNAGETNVDRWGGAVLEVGDVGFPETRAYVEGVLQKRDEYRDNYAGDLGLD